MRLAEGEWVIARLRSHGRELFWPTVFLLAICAGVGFGYGQLPEEWQNLAILAVAALLILVGCVTPYCRWLARTFTITSERTIVRSGVLVRSRQDVRHARVEEVTVRRGGLQLLFGTGDVVLDSGGARPTTLRDVFSPALVAEAIDEVLDQRPDGAWDDDDFDDDFPETSIR